MMRRSIAFLFLLLLNYSSLADEIRPGYLQLKETGPEIYSILWKVPAKGDKKLGLNVILPANCIKQSEASAQLINGAYISRWLASCKGGLLDRDITISGLKSTSTDVLLNMEFSNGKSLSAHLTPTRSTYKVPTESSTIQIISTYTWLGIEHILLGIDHLLFVFALLLIVQNWRRLIGTITAFTLAHSITLAAATLGYVQVPQQPVEAIIALSIVFLAMELVHGKQGRPGAAARYPWFIAFVFGLLHGFGFAGALAEVGLPQQAIPLALVFFNVGVELGQLIFIAVVLLLGWGMRRITQPKLLAFGEMAAIYIIGGLASFWLIERVSAF